MSASQAHPRELSEVDEIVDRLLERLSDAVVLARIVEAIRDAGLIPQPTKATAWLDAGEVAERLNMTREWVYAHANELGASRLGSGPRPRLRFPPDVVEPRTEEDDEPDTTPQAERRKPVGLIPIHGQ